MGRAKATLNKGEKLVCLISLGYSVTQGREHRNKPLNELCSTPGDMPAWFRTGMEAALLAPTAINQQKFFFELLPSNDVKTSCGTDFYARLDFGIVNYHFEAVTGKKTIR